jgi:multiple sugar transport system substrate-binding protein
MSRVRTRGGRWGRPATRRRTMGAALSAAALLPAGCGPLGALGGSRPGGAGADAVPGPSKGPVTLRYAHGWSTLYLDRLDKVVVDFNAKHSHITAEHHRLPDNSKLHEELSTALAAGAPPDVSMQWRGAMPAFAAKGALLALDGFIKRDRFDASIYYENEFRSSQFAGKVWVLPAAASGAWYLIFYNRDHFRDAGLDEHKPPTTWDEAVRFAGVLNRRAGDGKIERLGFEPALRDASLFNSPFAAWLATNGGTFASQDGRTLRFDSPQGAAALEWMQRVLQQVGGREAFDEFFARAKGGTESFPIGLRSMYLTNHSFPARLKQVAPDLRYGIGTLPRGTGSGATGAVTRE